MRRIIFWVSILMGFALMLLFSNCNTQSAGFALPEGSVADGKIEFVGLNCNTCHSVADIAWEGVEGQDEHFKLGGEVSRVKTYGELVTAIINPSHKLARTYRVQQDTSTVQSPMENYNEMMTVQQLVDLVTYLKKQYRLQAPPTEYYLY